MAFTSWRGVVGCIKPTLRPGGLEELIRMLPEGIGVLPLFLNIHEYLNKVAEMDEIDTVIKAYQLYQEQTTAQGLEQLLSVTRAWRLVKFVDNGMLTLTPCSKCGGKFVTHPHEIAKHYVCGLCNPPARAGKGRSSGGIQMH